MQYAKEQMDVMSLSVPLVLWRRVLDQYKRHLLAWQRHAWTRPGQRFDAIFWTTWVCATLQGTVTIGGVVKRVWVLAWRPTECACYNGDVRRVQPLLLAYASGGEGTLDSRAGPLISPRVRLMFRVFAESLYLAISIYSQPKTRDRTTLHLIKKNHSSPLQSKVSIWWTEMWRVRASHWVREPRISFLLVRQYTDF